MSSPKIYRSQVEPVTLQMAKEHLRVTHRLEDNVIKSYIRGATQVAEHFCDRLFMAATVEESFDTFPDDIITTYYPMTSLISLSYRDVDGDLQTILAADLYIDTISDQGRIKTKTTWPLISEGYNNVTVKYSSGISEDVSAIPESIVDGILLMVGHMYEHREDTVHKMPTASQRLLAQYKRTIV